MTKWHPIKIGCYFYSQNSIIKENKTMSKSQRDAIRIAKQLCYKADIIARIENAKTESEITQILHSAREREE